jgi:hypothetical protein
MRAEDKYFLDYIITMHVYLPFIEFAPFRLLNPVVQTSLKWLIFATT